MQIEILTIGGEILTVETLDTNFNFLARRLTRLWVAPDLAHHRSGQPGAHSPKALEAGSRREPTILIDRRAGRDSR